MPIASDRLYAIEPHRMNPSAPRVLGRRQRCGRWVLPKRHAAKALAVAVACVIVLNAQSAAIASIHLYQRALAPAAARIGLRCRFTPTCSRYAETVIARDGVVRGGWLTLKRIARCTPWTPIGTREEP